MRCMGWRSWICGPGQSQQVVKKCLCLARWLGVEEVMELHYFLSSFSPEYDHRHCPLVYILVVAANDGNPSL